MNELGRRPADRSAALARKLARSAVILLALAGASGCSSNISPPPPDPDPMSRTEYIIGPADILSIRVWKNPELSVEQLPVRVDGKISTPLANDVQASGLTPTQLRDVLTQKLAEYVTAPDVTVIVVQMNSRKVSVIGEVQRPGPVPIAVDTRVADAISAAGGFTQFANTRKVKILRRQPNGGVSEYRFNFPKWAGGGAPESNFLLQVDDTIVVPD